MRTINGAIAVVLVLATASMAPAAAHVEAPAEVTFEARTSAAGERIYTAATWEYAGPRDFLVFELTLAGGAPQTPLGLGVLRGADGLYRSPLAVRVPPGVTYRAAVCAAVAGVRACGEPMLLENGGDPPGEQEPTPQEIKGDEPFSWVHGGHPALGLWRVCVDDVACVDTPGGAAARGIPKLPTMTDGVHRVKACAAFNGPVEMRCGSGVLVRKVTPEPPRLPPTGEKVGQ